MAACLTSNSNGVSRSIAEPPLLPLVIAVVEVVQIPNVALLHAHEAGQTLHVFISTQQEKETIIHKGLN